MPRNQRTAREATNPRPSGTPTAHPFPRSCHRFFRELETHNDREWYAAHRADYHGKVLAPAREFVAQAGQRLRRFAAPLTADPRANGQGSISRIQRDVRFAADKTPYRTFLGILFWQGEPERKWDSPGFHLVFTPGLVKLTAGIRVFSPAQLAAWRGACGDPSLARVLRRLAAADMTLGGQHYRRVPRDIEPHSEQHGALLLHRGLFVTQETKIRVDFCGEEFVESCVATWRSMAPLNRWLRQLD